MASPGYAVTPIHLAADYDSSTDSDRRDLVKAFVQMTGRGLSREEAIEEAVEGGWSEEFAAWVHGRVLFEGEIEILAPDARPVVVKKKDYSDAWGCVLVPLMWAWWLVGVCLHLFTIVFAFGVGGFVLGGLALCLPFFAEFLLLGFLILHGGWLAPFALVCYGWLAAFGLMVLVGSRIRT